MNICRMVLGLSVDDTLRFIYNSMATTASNILAAISILVGDFRVIYRLWVVWSGNKLVAVLPSLTLIGVGVALFIAVDTNVHATRIAQDTGLTPGGPHLYPYKFLLQRVIYSFPLHHKVINYLLPIFSPGFIAWKIRRITKAASPQ
ncbi:hypothetical protein B0H11DRAFT_2079406 [Mycena galericulata]|nr:hypothetical protein B0H11DRAFT_2079406 [Mycena galericulata]